MSDPMNPIGDLPDNPAVEVESDSEEETQEHNVVYDLGEDGEFDEEFVNFRGNVTNCTFTTEILNVTQSKTRGQCRSTATAALPGGTMDEFLTHNEENELVYDDCSKEFYSITNKNQCVFKGRWLPNDMVSVGLREAHELIEC